MAEMITRKLPAGIQFFSIIRKEGYLYVDKTDLVWQLTHSGDLYNYLSRPRRFGKSLLIDTLQCYFEGKKELFEGLKIMELEFIILEIKITQAKNWKKLLGKHIL